MALPAWLGAADSGACLGALALRFVYLLLSGQV